MKEVRGAKALSYSREAGIRFNVDEKFIREAEGELCGEPIPMMFIQELVREQTGREYDPETIAPGDEVFDFFVNRYGDRWIYVALEGKNPGREEERALRIIRSLLEGPTPSPGGDVKEIFEKQEVYVFYDTGYPEDTDLNLLFHAAKRLVGKGLLVEVMDPDPLPARRKAAYGRRRFLVPADVEVALEGVLCEGCKRERLSSFLNLHRECAKRLRKVLLPKASPRA